MPLQELSLPIATRDAADGDALKRVVDIVAVHGLEENLTEAWKDPVTQILWLRDLLPQDLPTARILSYGYHAVATSFYGQGSADRIQQHAQTLVAELQADRALEDCSARPIIFICHGLGGILVKKALAYSSTRTSKAVQHLYSIYISTYAILFFGTPHHGADTAAWLGLAGKRSFMTKLRHSDKSALLLSVEKDCETLQTITEHFNHLMKRFKIFFLWEELQTEIGDRYGYVVEESSAAPIVDDTERAGIDADHIQMIRFSSQKSSSYRIIVEALRRYCDAAPSIILRRCQQAQKSFAAVLSDEAYELAGMSLNEENTIWPEQSGRRRSEQARNKFFWIPQAVSSIFTGREGIAALVKDAFWCLKQDSHAMQQKRFIIYGIGGSGKTQFCSKFWGVFWIDATSVETARQSFSSIGKLGGLEATQSAGKHWLANSEDPWLLIINNADDPALDLANLFPDGERGYVLVTTRNPNFRTQGTVGSKEFKGLEEREAIQLLLRAADTPRPWDQKIEILGRRIADALGYLALALIQAGALILQRMCDMRDYLEFYQDYRQRVGGRRASLDSCNEDQSAVYATWEHSIDSLQSRRAEAGRDAIELLSIVAFYHFEHIKVDIFVRALNNRIKALGAESGRSMKNRIWRGIQCRVQAPPVLPGFLREPLKDPRPYRIRRALHELCSFSLVSHDGKNDSFSLHPLVHAWARDRLDRIERELWAQIALNVLSESVLLPPEDRGEVHEEYRRDVLIHLDLCLKACPIEIIDFAAHFGGLKLPLAFTIHYGWLNVFKSQVRSAAKFGYVYLERGRFEDAARLLCVVKDALIVSRGYSDESTLRVMLALAHDYWGLGLLDKAIELQTKVIEIRREISGLKNPETLSAMDQLGKSYWLNGQYKESLDLQTRTVELMKVSLDKDSDATLSAMDNLGVSLGSWKRFQESKDLHDYVLKARHRISGQNDLETLTAMNNKAMALKDLGALGEAKDLMEAVVDERKQKLGKEHPWTLWAICNLAKVDTEIGLLGEAEELLTKGIAAGKRSLSDDHLGVLMGIGELARVLVRQERWQEAIQMAEDLIHRLERSRGLGHPDTLFAMSRLSFVYNKQGMLPRAIQICESAKERSTERLPEHHPLVQQIVKQLSTFKSETRGTADTHFENSSNWPDRSTSQGEAGVATGVDDELRRQQLKSRMTF